MSDLHQRIFVNCPSHAASSYIERFFDERRPVDAKGDPVAPIRMALRSPITLPALQTEIVLQRDVVATIAPQVKAEGALATFHVVWEPAGGGPFPRFEGTLTAASDEGYDSFSLILDGTYLPPFGLGGAAFDAALGHRIALATARNLLSDVRDGVERAYAATEHTKKLKRDEMLRNGTAPE